MIGAFIEPTEEIRSADNLLRLGISFEPGSPLNPSAVCARNYDREFAPLGEQYEPHHWGRTSRGYYSDPNRSRSAIIDVNTVRSDFGQVALAWMPDGTRVKLFIDQFAPVPQLPEGCFAFSELSVDQTLPRNRMRQSRAPFALTD